MQLNVPVVEAGETRRDGAEPVGSGVPFHPPVGFLPPPRFHPVREERHASFAGLLP